MARQPIEPLTARERTVLELLRRGLTNAQIASDLDITEHTVKDHVSAILRKLGVPNRHAAAYWPEDAPWWARVPVLAPLASFLRRTVNAGVPAVAVGLAAIVLVAVIAAMAFFAVLVLQTDPSSAVISEDARDLEPGTTLYVKQERYRRFGAIEANSSPGLAPETLSSERWIEFDSTGALRELRTEVRTPYGTLQQTVTTEGTDIVTRDAQGAELFRTPIDQLNLRSVAEYKKEMSDILEQVRSELAMHPDAPTSMMHGFEVKMIEERKDGGSYQYTRDLNPVGRIDRHYYSAEVARPFRSETWVVDAEGNETLVEYSDTLVHEILAN